MSLFFGVSFSAVVVIVVVIFSFHSVQVIFLWLFCVPLNVYDFFGLPCELFELQAICIEKFFSPSFALLHFFYDLFRLWVCVWTECFTRKKMRERKNKSTKFSLRRKPFICRHAVRSIENSGKEQEIVSLHDTKTHQLIAFSLSLIAHTHIFSDRMAKGVRNIYMIEPRIISKMIASPQRLVLNAHL